MLISNTDNAERENRIKFGILQIRFVRKLSCGREREAIFGLSNRQLRQLRQESVPVIPLFLRGEGVIQLEQTCCDSSQTGDFRHRTCVIPPSLQRLKWIRQQPTGSIRFIIVLKKEKIDSATGMILLLIKGVSPENAV